MAICKDCIHYKICDPYVAPNESFPEVEGGCNGFKNKADFVEVVRCKDCKERYQYEEFDRDIKESVVCNSCFKFHRYFGDNGFCSYGERRDR